jgi:phosphosulfolactate phosphohydrolase-like enzyme
VTDARFLARWEVADVIGAVVSVDVIRAFTTAAYAFAAGASHIFLVDSVDEALAMKAADPDVLAMGEDRGRRPAGFDRQPTSPRQDASLIDPSGSADDPGSPGTARRVLGVPGSTTG